MKKNLTIILYMKQGQPCQFSLDEKKLEKVGIVRKGEDCWEQLTPFAKMAQILP